MDLRSAGASFEVPARSAYNPADDGQYREVGRVPTFVLWSLRSDARHTVGQCRREATCEEVSVPHKAGMSDATDWRRLLEPGVGALGFEFVDAELVGGNHHATLRVYIDNPKGVDVDDCAAVSRQLSALLDVEDPLPGGYALEVSSPGLDRPLVTPAHFRRFAGEMIKVKLARPLAGRRKITGRLTQAADDHVVVEAEGVGGATEKFTLAYADIERARLVPRLHGSTTPGMAEVGRRRERPPRR